ncbi:MAG: ribonuclease Y [Clostridia bacterium]|nr:ribonuclease Y [Clostridia bacterium]
MQVLPYLVVAVLFSCAFFCFGILYRKKVAESEIGQAEVEARRIINEAIKSAEAKKKEATLEAKEEAILLRAEAEKELKERRSEISKQERRIQQKEESLDKKAENYEQKEEKLNRKLKEADALREEIEEFRRQEWDTLERISGFTIDQAKEYLLNNLENEIKHESALRIKENEQRAKEESEQRAREIVTMAIQRYAADFVAEATVSVVPLPSDEMKGRIIGREGRNIRTIETMTGVDLIIDDTPEAITISCFDPVRREIARIALERLVHDGRIHPAKIEETVEKARRDVENTIKQEGERATFETGVYGLHPELVKLIGRMKYRSSYGQNLLQHSREVANICATMASELGLNPKVAKRAGLLHDIGKVSEEEPELPHALLGMKLAEKYKEKPEICNAIGAHHEEIEMNTLIAPLVLVADAISGARPGARREVIESYIKRLKDMEGIALSYPGVTKTYAIQAGRELRVIVGAEEVTDKQCEELSAEIARKIQDEMVYPGQIKITVIRETRSVAFAK